MTVCVSLMVQTTDRLKLNQQAVVHTAKILDIRSVFDAVAKKNGSPCVYHVLQINYDVF